MLIIALLFILSTKYKEITLDPPNFFKISLVLVGYINIDPETPSSKKYNANHRNNSGTLLAISGPKYLFPIFK
jgi:hypothetical protein